MLLLTKGLHDYPRRTRRLQPCYPVSFTFYLSPELTMQLASAQWCANAWHTTWAPIYSGRSFVNESTTPLQIVDIECQGLNNRQLFWVLCHWKCYLLCPTLKVWTMVSNSVSKEVICFLLWVGDLNLAGNTDKQDSSALCAQQNVLIPFLSTFLELST